MCSGGSTSNLMKHLKKQHSIWVGISRQSITIDEMFGPSKWKYNQEEMRNKLVKWIVIEQHPFTIVEEEDFINFVYSLYPNIEIPFADTIKRDIMELYVTNVAKMQTVLQKLQNSIALSDKDFRIHVLADNQWHQLEKIMNFL
ncbi:6579_t:CDS:2 [Diversispora eburnea]|uniref:6579_t:CDS:1 n=1 Tax=Diversispora eburnea TaxID=1213867 RepID=A0A9N8VNE5_9GLOM|nr:6579_t:CDS:2 [Diversispora eburnea]